MTVSSGVRAGMIVSPGVVDHRVEAVLVGVVLDGADVTAGFLERVFPGDVLPVAMFLLPVEIARMVILDAVSEGVLGMSDVIDVVMSDVDLVMGPDDGSVEMLEGVRPVAEGVSGHHSEQGDGED